MPKPPPIIIKPDNFTSIFEKFKYRIIDNSKDFDHFDESVIGEEIANGEFGSIYNHKDSNLIVKESIGILYFRKACINKEVNYVTLENLISDIEGESDSVKNFCSYKSIFPENIITCHGIYKRPFKIGDCDAYKYYMIFDKVDGVDLYKFNPSDYKDILKLYIQAIYVIMYLNKNGVYHNDISSKNLMVGNKKEVINLKGLLLGNQEIKFKFESYPLIFIDYGFSRNTKCSHKSPIEVNSIGIIFDSFSQEYPEFKEIIREFNIFDEEMISKGISPIFTEDLNNSPISLFKSLSPFSIESQETLIKNFTILRNLL